MSCTGNSGFIEITGSLLSINTIKLDSYPVTLNIAPRTTVPDIVGNRINESTVTSSTCRDLNGNTFTLNDIQICSVTNKGYSQNKPDAELIVSFLANSKADTLGVLLCVYIYDSGHDSNADYISQLWNTQDTTKIVTLESIFKTQSFGYKTCFETIDDNKVIDSKNLYVVVFPDGIHLTSKNYQKLLDTIGDLVPYRVPPAIRGGEYTVRNYKFNNKGKKIVTGTNKDGIIYSTPISSCSKEFKDRFYYFLKPPDIPKTGSTDKCTYYNTNQYKCVPFDKLKDLSGEIVIPEGATTLKTVLGTKASDAKDSDSSLSADAIDEIIVGVVLISLVCMTGLFVYKVILPNL